MAQDVNARQREQSPDDEEWFDLRSLAPAEDPSDTPVEVYSAPKSRAYYAPSLDDTERPVDPSVSVRPPFQVTRPHAERSYGPLLYFAFLVLIPVASVALFVLASPDSAPDEPTGEEQASLPDVNLAPPVAAFRVDSDPEGALVYIDEKLAGVTPYEDRAVEPGWRAFSLEKSGHAVRDTLIYVGPEAANSLTLVLAPLDVERESDEAPASAPPPTPEVNEWAAQPAESAEQPTEARAAAREIGEMQIVTTPARAVVRLDGKTVGRTPLLLGDLAPGMYEVTLSLPGYASHTRRVNVGPGRRSAVRATLAARTGTLSVLVYPWGSIYVDGELLARDTDVRRSIDVAVGPHVVRVEHPVLGVQERTIEVQAGQTTTVDFDLL